jgi:hypothetical protein
VKHTMRFVGGPYAGQTVELPLPEYRRDHEGRYLGPVPYLVNVWSGSALHCYLTVPNGDWSVNWRLEYQEEF